MAVAAQLEPEIGPPGRSGEIQRSGARPDLEALGQFADTGQRIGMSISDEIAESERAMQFATGVAAFNDMFTEYARSELANKASPDSNLERFQAASSRAQAAILKGTTNYRARDELTAYFVREESEMRSRARKNSDVQRQATVEETWKALYERYSHLEDSTTTQAGLDAQVQKLKAHVALGQRSQVSEVTTPEGASRVAQVGEATLRREWLARQKESREVQLQQAVTGIEDYSMRGDVVGAVRALGGAGQIIPEPSVHDVQQDIYLNAGAALLRQDQPEALGRIVDGGEGVFGKEFHLNEQEGKLLGPMDEKTRLSLRTDLQQYLHQQSVLDKQDHERVLSRWIKEFDEGRGTLDSLRRSGLLNEPINMQRIVAGTVQPNPVGSFGNYKALRQSVLSDVVMGVKTPNELAVDLMQARYTDRKINDSQYRFLRTLLARNYPSYVTQGLQEGFASIDRNTMSWRSSGNPWQPIAWDRDEKRAALMNQGLLQWVDDQIKAGQKPTAKDVTDFVDKMSNRKPGQEQPPQPDTNPDDGTPHSIPADLWALLSPLEQDKVREKLAGGADPAAILALIRKNKNVPAR